jgi:hypothetical protein
MPTVSPKIIPNSGGVSILTINGTAYDLAGRRTPRLLIDSIVPLDGDGIQHLSFIRHSQAPGALPDSFLCKPVSWSIGGSLYFAGDSWSRHEAKPDENHKYAYRYECLGLRARGERFPLTDQQTGTDTSSFNLSPEDPAYIASKAGRTSGQVIMSVLEMATNSANLIAAGIGNYSAGSGASANATASGGVVTGITGLVGGSGYTTAPTVVFAGGGYTTMATGHATVSGGVVTGIVIDSGGSGYKTAPAVIISRLPAATVNDLAAINIIPPFPCIVRGEKFLNAIETFLKAVHPNHLLLVYPDGTIRFLDQRKFAGTTVSFSGGGGQGAIAVARVNPVTGAITALDLIEGGFGYSIAPAVAITGSPGSGATATATVTGGSVTGLSLTAAGANYLPGRTLILTAGLNIIEPPSFHRDASNSFPRVIARGRPYVEGIELALSKGDIAQAFGHDGLSNTDAIAHWKSTDYDQPSAPSGAAVVTAVLATAGVSTVTVNNGGTGYTSAPTVTFSGGGGTGATATAAFSGGHVTSITVTASGSGYATSPTVVISGGGGTGATATANLPGRAVASLNLIDGGYNYTSAPSVAFLGGGGSGATATTTISSGSVTGLTLTAGGSGYTSAPQVHVQGPIGQSVDYGTCTCISTTTIRVTSDEPTRTWATNFWDQTDAGKHGVIFLRSSVDGTIAQLCNRRIIANTSLSPGGTSDITPDRALDITTFDSYSIRGLTVGGSIVWRKYSVTNPNIAGGMTDEPFTYAFAFHASDGAADTLTSMKTAAILWSSSGVPPYFQSPLDFDIDPVAGTITFRRPVVFVNNFDTTNLRAGGADVGGQPNDIRVVVGVYKQNLKSTQPADSGGSPVYTGTSNTIEGKTDTLTVQLNDWRDPINQSQIDSWVAELLDSVKDTIVEGDISYSGLLEAALTPMLAIGIAGWNGASFTTGWEAALPVLRVELKWNHQGGPLAWTTTLHLSNRRSPYTAMPFLSPPRTGMTLGFEQDTIFGAGLEFNQGVGPGGYMPYGGIQELAEAPFRGSADTAFDRVGVGASQGLGAPMGNFTNVDAAVNGFGGMPGAQGGSFDMGMLGAGNASWVAQREAVADQARAAKAVDQPEVSGTGGMGPSPSPDTTAVSFADMGSAIYQAQHSPQAEMKQQAEQGRQDIAEAKQQHREMAERRLEEERQGGDVGVVGDAGSEAGGE